MNDLARHTPWLHGAVTAYSNDGVVLFGLLLVAGFLLARSRRDPLQLARSVLAGAGVLLAVAVNQPLGDAVAERRLYDQLPGVLVLVHRSVDACFLSDHARPIDRDVPGQRGRFCLAGSGRTYRVSYASRNRSTASPYSRRLASS